MMAGYKTEQCGISGETASYSLLIADAHLSKRGAAHQRRIVTRGRAPFIIGLPESRIAGWKTTMMNPCCITCLLCSRVYACSGAGFRMTGGLAGDESPYNKLFRFFWGGFHIRMHQPPTCASPLSQT